MTQPPAVLHNPVPPVYPWVGAFLSFLVPGLGQIFQGIVGKNSQRLTKGLLFLVALWGMFWFGMWLGKWQNVYLPPFAQRKPVFLFGRELPHLAGNLYTRLHYVGQFWIGVAAWPALWHYYQPDSPLFGDFQRVPAKSMVLHGRNITLAEAEAQIRNMQAGDPEWARNEYERLQWEALQEAEAQLNAVQLDPAMGKNWDIAWVYTVIAGVLNILVIFDALGGPMFPRPVPASPPSSSPAVEGRAV